MSGYTDDALNYLKDGERLEVLLLTSEHVEAMLAGLTPPDELFELLLDFAHFYGDPTRPCLTSWRPNSNSWRSTRRRKTTRGRPRNVTCSLACLSTGSPEISSPAKAASASIPTGACWW
jgi:hypothetical protein